MPDSATTVLWSGTSGPKVTVAVLGDGFTEADQKIYNDAVDALLLRGVFGHDCFAEDASAFRVVRVNLMSRESGVSERVYDEHGTYEDASDDTIVSTTLRDTALGYIFSGSWAHCWLEPGQDSWTRIYAALDRWVPDYQLVVIILNNRNYGGCGGGGCQIVPLGVDWPVMAHEFGHGAGGLDDEYATCGTWTSGEPSWSVNITTNTDRNTLKWGRFVAPSTPIPTGVNSSPGNGWCTDWTEGPRPADWSSCEDAGLFEGAGYRDSGVYRPVENCRMRGNQPPFCPVCYTHVKGRYDSYAERAFHKVILADVTGDGRDDLVVHNPGSLTLYEATGFVGCGTGARFLSHAVGAVPDAEGLGIWSIADTDRYLPVDLDGDGLDELVAVNAGAEPVPRLGVLHTDSSGRLRVDRRYDGDLPGWRCRPHDQWLTGDVDGDGHGDLVVFNGEDWAVPCLGVFRWDGAAGTSGELALVARYDGTLPGWTMRRHDTFSLGDVDKDGCADLIAFNGVDGTAPRLSLLRSTGTGFARLAGYEKSVSGWTLRPNDQLLVADFDGDGRSDLYAFNGTDWPVPRLGMLQSTGSGLQQVHRYEGTVPGWTLRPNDRFSVAHVQADARAGLLVHNWTDTDTQYLGSLASNGTALSGYQVQGWLGEWDLGADDLVVVGDLEGDGFPRTFMLHNADWLGIGRTTPMGLDRLYYRWIHDYHHGRNW